MADKKHLEIIMKGVAAWNEWRDKNPHIKPDLSGADLSGADLQKVGLWEAKLSNANLTKASLGEAYLSCANLDGAILCEAHLDGAILIGASLRGSDLSHANLVGTKLMGASLIEANLWGANLKDANLSDAELIHADLSDAELIHADLTGSDLSKSNIVRTNFERANLTDCRIYGISAWNLNLHGATQSNLIITPQNEPTITLDNLEVAQFIYLLLNNEKLRDVIDTITSKVVLILGCFKPERKSILDAIKEEIRNCNYLPILFDFEKPHSRNTTETITLLARMARFVIADITDAKSIPQELCAIVPHLPSVPVQPLLESSQKEYGMFESFKSYPWILETYYYESKEEILASIKEKVINPAEQKAQEIVKKG